MLKLARWSTTHRLYVVIGWIVLMFGRQRPRAVGGHRILQQLHAAQLRRAARRGPAAAQLPRAGRRPRPDRLPRRIGHGPRPGGPPTHERDLRGGRKAAARRGRDQPLRRPCRRQGDLRRPDRSRSRRSCSTKKPTCCPRARRTRRQGRARPRDQPGLQVELGGQAIEATEQEGFGLSTAVGLLAAIVVLLLTFGSLLAMGLPIVTALFGLGTGLGVIALFTHVVDTPNFSSELAAMIGLGVGIDYSLFILTRFREAYIQPGAHPGRCPRVGRAGDGHRRARRPVRRHAPS